ncbi:family 2A encapsulin nanocompartment shell protein [Nannocystis radixulma]|uniref:Family 2A encapsulin nanocompartment shell protein n=1 Tax=Nannocystis radixulma TaxID=2995305 RepID=A0ABT5B431_9BACT|nr:family 2A encapsulin nanocompartment shell protein [Nannocystis radixulma]MDC0667821.1 family 2A encapsulin nanocompartment shell protein [Nannocystis radixulma]
MADRTVERRNSIGERAARQLANTTKTPPQWRGATPRWLTQMLPWTPVEAGVFRLNQALDDDFEVRCSPESGEPLPRALSDYDVQPREYVLTSITTTVEIDTRVSDLFRSPMDQVKEQLTLAVEKLKEKQERELLNNRSYGLLNNVDPDMKLSARSGRPSPDDMDELISMVWKEPAFFLAHPKAIAAFGRECTRRGVPPATTMLFGSHFLTWRGLPLVPCDKLPIRGNKTDILLLRTGERKRGVVGLFQPGIPGEVSPSLSVRLMGINQAGAAYYLLSLYCSVAVLTHDALGMLEGVVLDHYYEYT